MEICLDFEEPSIMQSQNLEMMVEEFVSKEANMEEHEKIKLEEWIQAKHIPKMPIQAKRRSTRQVGSGTLVMEKAKRLKANKNLQGTSQNPFSVQQIVDNDHLAKIATACNMVLGDNECMIDEFIDILKAKENAQAEITRLERAKETEKEVVIVEEIEESEDECPEGHCLLVEELTIIEERTQEDPLPGKAGRGKKKTRFK